jgi:hypothetical protein
VILFGVLMVMRAARRKRDRGYMRPQGSISAACYR